MAETRQPLHIVGAGPVGSLLALFLARRGFDVEVYERRPDLRREKISAGRSINLAVSTRGIFALEQVGLEKESLRSAVPMRGRMLHAVSGGLRFLAYGAEHEFINSLSRGGINALLMDAAERAHRSGGGRVRIHFHTRLLNYDFATQEARLRTETQADSGRRRGETNSGERVVAAPIIFGTDGSASALREAMIAQRGISSTEEVLDFGYKELTLPPTAGAVASASRFSFEPNALHIWPRGSLMLIALPNTDGSFTCTLFLPFEAREGSTGFSQLRDASEIEDFFRANFADVLERIPDLAAQFAAAPLGQMVTVRTDRWNADRALLLGDAAHAIVPFFGQGMNAGFEDCALLAAQLDARLGENKLDGDPDRIDWAALFETFSAARKPDADAIAELALENFVEMRDRVADPGFLLQRALEGELQKRLGSSYRSRYQLVTFSRVPYRAAREAGLIQSRILQAACSGKSSLAEIDVDQAVVRAEAELLPFLRLQMGAIDGKARDRVSIDVD